MSECDDRSLSLSLSLSSVLFSVTVRGKTKKQGVLAQCNAIYMCASVSVCECRIIIIISLPQTGGKTLLHTLQIDTYDVQSDKVDMRKQERRKQEDTAGNIIIKTLPSCARTEPSEKHKTKHRKESKVGRTERHLGGW